MSEQIVRSNLGDGVYRLRMNSDATRNTLTNDFCTDLMVEIEQLARDPDVRVLLLTGATEVFCAGGSLETLRAVAEGDFEVKDLALPRVLLGFPLPVIGAVRGHAVGGGLALALCCDITVAAEDRRYGANFMAMGFTPGMGVTALLPALAGYSMAAEMMFTARFYTGRELAGRGLFTHVVPGADVEMCAEDIARRISEKPRDVLELLKETLSAPRRAALEAAISREHLMHRICFDREGTRNRIEAEYLGANG